MTYLCEIIFYNEIPGVIHVLGAIIVITGTSLIILRGSKWVVDSIIS